MNLRKIIPAISVIIALSIPYEFKGLKSTKTENRFENISLVPLNVLTHSPLFQLYLTDREKEAMTLPVSEFMRLYTDCDQKIYNQRTFEYAKGHEEIISGVRRRKYLEDLWTRHFYSQVNAGYSNMHYVDTTSEEWYDPLNGSGQFSNSFNDPRYRRGRWRERHESIDIFAKKGQPVHSILAGVVVAAGDNWSGLWKRRRGTVYNGGGLGELSGNALIIFHPQTGGYSFYAHGQNGIYANPGDVVSRGQEIMQVGKTGNAFSPYLTPHLHFSYKEPGTECGVDGVLVAKNPYWNLKESREVMFAGRDGKSFIGSY